MYNNIFNGNTKLNNVHIAGDLLVDGGKIINNVESQVIADNILVVNNERILSKPAGYGIEISKEDLVEILPLNIININNSTFETDIPIDLTDRVVKADGLYYDVTSSTGSIHTIDWLSTPTSVEVYKFKYYGLIYDGGKMKIVKYFDEINYELAELEYDMSNVSVDSLGVLDTKGQLLTFNGTTHEKLNSGADGQILISNSLSFNGLQWSSPIIPDTFISILTKRHEILINEPEVHIASIYWKGGEGILTLVTDGEFNLTLNHSGGSTNFLIPATTANNFININIPQGNLDFSIDSISDISNIYNMAIKIEGSGLNNPNVGLKTITINSNFIISNEDVIFIDTSTSPITLTLPTPEIKKITIIDKTGNANVNNVTLNGNIIAKTYSESNFFKTIYSDGSIWYAEN